jgi:two-component system, OmpR family, phosphate regulon response regulator PhoB
MLPGSLDGLALCRGLKGDPLTGGAAVVMLTARGNAVDRVAAAEAGASAFLVKPFIPLELIRRLEGLGVAA